jgi:signal transduction histidine kinase
LEPNRVSLLPFTLKERMSSRAVKLCLPTIVYFAFLVWAVALKCPAAESGNANQPAPEAASASLVLTNTEQIHRLTRQEAGTGLPVLIRGIITCTLPEFEAAVVQQGTTGIYFTNSNPQSVDIPQVGELVEVGGITDPGDFAPRVKATHVARLGTGELPNPVHPYWDQMINGSLDTDFVEIEGIVTSIFADGVTLRTHDGKINVFVYETGGGTNDVPLKLNQGALIRMRGCLFASWDGNTHQVKVSEVRMYNPLVTEVEPPPADAFASALKSVPDLLLFDSRASALRWVKVSGQIMHEREGEYYAMDGTNGFRFITGRTMHFAVGELVEVVGFPSLTGPSPVLQDALARKTGVAPLRDARQLGADSLFRDQNDAVRVKVEALLLNLSPDHKTLELQTGLQRFIARIDNMAVADSDLAAPGTGRSKGQDLPVGSRLELTGVYAGIGGNRPTSEKVASFELLLNSLADIQVLERPPFWTLQRTLVLVAALLCILGLALAWIRLLHRQVQQRTEQLRIEVHQREQAEQRHALAQERTRIARDLHDDLGSSLTEITMLATAGPGLKPAADDAVKRMETIAGKSRTLLNALDELVWAVDPECDTLASVVRYLASFVEEYLAGMKIVCRVQIPNAIDDQVISGEVRHHLFLAVKEALTNAVRHGAATEIGFRVRLGDAGLLISITDNGSGFDASSHSDGYGLSNLRQRLEQLHGRCELQSVPGGGTTVSLQVPLPARNHPS